MIVEFQVSTISTHGGCASGLYRKGVLVHHSIEVIKAKPVKAKHLQPLTEIQAPSINRSCFRYVLYSEIRVGT
jgi:hypothetical protein